MKQMGPSKEVIPGKVVLVTKPEHVGRLGIVLKVETSRQYGLIYKILILCEEDEAPKSENAPDKWLDCLINNVCNLKVLSIGTKCWVCLKEQNILLK